MKKFLFFLLSLALLTLLLQPFLYSDVEDEEHAVILVPVDEVIEQNYRAFGEKVRIQGKVKGNVYVASQYLLIDGTVDGNVYAASVNIEISGHVSGSVHLISAQVIISGSIDKNITVCTGDLEVSPYTVIMGNIRAAAANIRFDGFLKKNFTVLSGYFTLTGHIDGNVHAAVGKIRLLKDAFIEGSLDYWSRQKISMQKGSVIKGKVTPMRGPLSLMSYSKKTFRRFMKPYIFTKIASFISLLVIGLFFIHQSPQNLYKATEILKEYPIKTLWTGIILVILIPIIILFLLITLVGIPLAFNLIALYLIQIYIIKIFTIFPIGILVFKRMWKKLAVGWAYSFALLCYFLITLIPIVGVIVIFLSLFWGFGSAYLVRRRFKAIIKQNVTCNWDNLFSN